MSPSPKIKYVFKATKLFHRQLDKLPENQKEIARQAYKVFKKNPFDQQLRPHKINYLSAHLKRTVWAVKLNGDFRVVFYQDGNIIMTLYIGGHEIYGR